MLNKDSAICIRVADYSETSQIATFFTRANGKISTIAKGSKRPKSPFDGPIEILSQGRIVFSDSGKEKLAVLTEFEQTGSLTHLAGSLFNLNCSYSAAELVNSLTDEHDPHPLLFDSFQQFLQDVQQTQEAISLLILFQLSLLKEIGLQPILSCCTNCKTNLESLVTGQETYFSSSANGLVCKDCEANFPDKINLTKDAAKCLTNLKLVTQAEKDALKEIEKILLSHFTEILGHKPKMAKHILQE